MTSIEVNEFERFLQESFDGDVLTRELRLSSEEKEMVQSKYPGACFSIIPSKEYQDGKQWYEIAIKQEE
ncbi:MAG TPA: hypothetical protein VHT34_07325 [Clostridia bacterium]|nr:hypothetical protein [Clostridia bacterium]